MSRAGLRVLRNHNNKPTYNSEENPKLGHNLGYVKFFSNGLKASRSGLCSSLQNYYIVKYSIKFNAEISVEQDWTAS